MTHGSTEDDVGRGGPATVFVSDPSAEAERVAQALRSAGYVVVDVPQSMLVARVAVQRPRVILVDADTEGALDVVARVRELPDAESLDVVFLARPGGVLRSAEEAFAQEGSGLFERPVDVQRLVEKVDALTGGVHEARPRSSPPPSSPLPASSPRPSPLPGDAPRPPSSRPPPSRPPPASLPPASMRPAEGIRPPQRNTPKPPSSVAFLSSPPAEMAPASMRRATSVQAPLSSELEALLQEAEQRISGQMAHDSLLPSPEEEIEAVLPAEVLASLDDPLEDEDDDDLDGAMLGAVSRGNTTGAGRVTTGGASATGAGSGEVPAGTDPPLTPGALRRSVSIDAIGERASKTNAGTHHGATHSGSQHGVQTTGSRGEGTSESARRDDLGPSLRLRGAPDRFEHEGAWRAPSYPSTHLIPARGAFEAPAAPAPPPVPRPVVPTILGPGDAPRALATTIATRATGVLTFESRAGMRRAVLREGDLVTAASSNDDENLLAFLAARGELPRDRVEQLSGKLPPFGRHAGAALVAHGHLRQDQLWSVLRAHAEWLLGRAVALDVGSAILEADAPGRLKGEPSVFGGSTGAEVFVEVVRRVVSPEEAVARLGGESARIEGGPNGALMSECALSAPELDWIQRARGGGVGEALGAATEADLASVLYALSLLGVVEVLRPPGAPRLAGAGAGARMHPMDEAPGREGSRAIDLLDEEAIRARIRARLALVDEGDYFAVLGIAREATGYEVKRAYLELRRAFEPSKILTPRLADLHADVGKITGILDEAYEILRDGARRERYRRAIDDAARD